jgi:hypothetical protein
MSVVDKCILVHMVGTLCPTCVMRACEIEMIKIDLKKTGKEK